MNVNNHIFVDSTKNNIEIDKSFDKINNNLHIVSLVIQNYSLSELRKMAFLNTGNDKASSLVRSARNIYLIETEKLGYPISDDEKNTFSIEIEWKLSSLIREIKNRIEYFKNVIESEKSTLSIAIKYIDAEKKVIDVESSIENILKIAHVFKFKEKNINGIITEIKNLKTENNSRSRIVDEIFEAILSKKSFNYQTNESASPLIERIIEYNYSDLIPILLKNGLDCNYRLNKNGIIRTPFDKSMFSGDHQSDYTIAELFLEHGVDESLKHKHLHIAVIMGHRNKLEMLIKYIKNIDIKDENGYTALTIAINNKNLVIATILLNNKANPFIQDESGNTIFHKYYERPKKLTQLLLQDAVDLNITNQKGETALHKLITYNLEEAKLFLEKGADPNIIDNEGNAPLHIALLSNYKPGRAELLLENRADPNIINNKGEALLHLLVSDFRYSKDKLEFLLKKNANPNIINSKGNAPLHLAVENYSDNAGDKLETLLENRADPNIINNEGKTPLHLVAPHCSDRAKGMVQSLLKYGANPHIKDKEGKTAFDVASDDIKKLLPAKKRIQLSSILTLILKKINSIYKSLLHFLDKLFTSVSNFMRLSNKKIKPISIPK